MTRRVVVSPLAREDLIDIAAYIARDNPLAADRLLDRLHDKSRLLADFPGIGRPISRVRAVASTPWETI